MPIPNGLFCLDPNIRTIDAAIEALSHLDLNWKVQPSEQTGGKSAIAVLERDTDGNIWAVAAIENNWPTHHRHNNEDGDYGEMIIALAGLLPDITDEGKPVSLTPGTVIFHAGGTQHDKFYSEFRVGVYNQPPGSTPLD